MNPEPEDVSLWKVAGVMLIALSVLGIFLAMIAAASGLIK